MAQLVISPDDLATIIEAAYFYNVTAVIAGLLIYDVLSSCFRFWLLQYKRRQRKQKSPQPTN
ncbi:hypothetical protein [Vibrio navarrensis]|uniref:Uncharacterized protein n=1 Tax=Vibrio navarrensis TaxID=29495 RepID=A0AAJ4IDN2_9VIBR|nr:hypothetical protein I3X05_07525 [Vibrio navarrensis]